MKDPRKTTRHGLTLLLVAAALTTVFAQPLPVMLYGDTLNERALALVEADVPGEYCLAGWTESFGPPGVRNVLVIRTDALGLPVWSRVSTGQHDDEAWSMTRTHDQGYALTGWTGSWGIGAPNHSLFILKLASNGGQTWGWTYGGEQDDEAYSIIETSDHGFAVCGLTHSFGPPPHPNILVMKTTGTGQPVWLGVYWRFGEHNADEAYAIIETPDSGFAVVGRMHAMTPTNFEPFVLKLDARGAPQWLQIVPGEPADDEGYAVALDQAGTILASGWTQSFGTSPGVTKDIFHAGFNLAGVPLWSFTYGWPGGDEEVLNDRALWPTNDGGSVLCGPTTSVGPGVPRPNFLVVKVAPGGPMMWARSHPSSYEPGLLDDVPMALVQCYPRHYAVAGWTNSFPYLGREDFHLLTLDSLGNRPVCVDSQMPLIDSMPWIPWDIEGELAQPAVDTFMTAGAEPLFYPICEETTAVREGRMPDPAPARLALTTAGGWLRLAVDREVEVEVVAWSADGRLLATVANRRFRRGVHVLTVPPGPAGVVLVRAEGGGATAVSKLVRY